MKWTPLKLATLKLGAFALVLAYMAGDLWFVHGPVYRLLHRSDASPEELALSVYGEPISKAQFARYTAEQNLLSGRKKEDPALRASMALGMAREALVNTRARYKDLHLPDLEEPAQEVVKSLATRNRDQADFEQKLASQGYTIRSLTDRLKARMRGQALLEQAVAPVSGVSDEAVAAHYEMLLPELRCPAQRPVSHIFFSFDGQDPLAVKARAEAAMLRLQNGGDFAALAAELSEDERSRDEGGALGFIPDDGRTPLAELPIFDTAAVPDSTPVLVQSRWGWHILKAGPIVPAYTPTPEEAQDTLHTAIESAQRELGVNRYFDEALREGIHNQHIRLYVK